jgi:hypothetical protein
MDMSLDRRVLSGPLEVAERQRMPNNWQECCLHPIVKLTCLEGHSYHFLRVPSETIQRRLGLPNEHTYIVDADLFIGVCLRSLSESVLDLKVKYCRLSGTSGLASNPANRQIASSSGASAEHHKKKILNFFLFFFKKLEKYDLTKPKMSKYSLTS